MDTSLTNQVAIVTGGAGGIGQAYSRALAREGACVAVADVHAKAATAFAEELQGEGLEAMGVEVDVTDPESTKAMATKVVEAYGGIDILVNNAGIMSAIPTKGSLLEVTPDSWDLAMRVNAMSVLMCAQAVVPWMRERGGGKIINQASTAAFEPGGLYRISKHTVVALTAGLGFQLGPENINVNGIAPGMIQTEEGFRSAGALGSDKRTARSQGVPNPRPDREPEALVGALLLLASESGDYMNGQTLILDGGRNMRL